jgi:hypothetical protein
MTIIPAFFVLRLDVEKGKQMVKRTKQIREEDEEPI